MKHSLSFLNNQDYKEIQKAAFFAAENNFEYISVSPALIEYFKPYISTIKMGVIIDDAPLELKQYALLHSIRREAKVIEFSLNNGYLINNEIHKFKKEVSVCLAICTANKVELRPILDFSLFDEKSIIDICNMFTSMGVDTVITSNGIVNHDILDNLTIAQKVTKETGIRTVLSCPMVLEKHFRLITNPQNNIFGFRFTSVPYFGV